MGAVYVMRAAQSKGIVDLAVFWPDESLDWFVQCKTGSARMSPADRKQLVELAHAAGAVPVLAQPGKNGRGVEFTVLEKEHSVGRR